MIDISPCGPHNYNGVTALDQSGRMVPPQYNWDTWAAPRFPDS
jgi:hypothetical protein